MEKLDGQSMDIIADNIDKMKQLFPDAFSEGKIDFDALKALLGDRIENSDERYQFNWNGKNQARMIAQTPSMGTLRPSKEESVDWDNTHNLFIEGDNLEVLKLLQKSYHKKVKMIYIDPPYNTGKDFVYKDNFKDNIKNYKSLTGQVDGEGRNLSSNPETSGRYHTDWLNMMYPRLKLARNLLQDDGVIFISIDDNEVTNLRKVCDEIFGEENFVAEFVWKRRASSALADNHVSSDHEYVIAYHKSNLKEFKGIEKDFMQYKNPDNDPRGPWVLGDLTVGMTASMRPNQAYELIDPDTGHTYPYNPNRVWAYIPSSMDKMLSEGRVVFPKDPSKRPMQKRFQTELKNSFNPISSLIMDKVGLNTEATKLMQQILGGNIFDYSKPLSLLTTLIPQVANDTDIVLDFFAGSASTAHAVMQLNAEDQGQRKFIMVQLPEATDEKSEAFKAGYRTIAEISKERIRRAAASIKTEQPDYKGDLGFKAFKLDSSNIQAWDVGSDISADDLLAQVEHIKAERSEADVLYEILLKYGHDLSVPIAEHSIAGQTVYVIGNGSLLVCLGDAISLEVVDAMVQIKDNLQPSHAQVVFKDTGFGNDRTQADVTKANAVQTLKQAGITDVRSL